MLRIERTENFAETSSVAPSCSYKEIFYKVQNVKKTKPKKS